MSQSAMPAPADLVSAAASEAGPGTGDGACSRPRDEGIDTPHPGTANVGPASTAIGTGFPKKSEFPSDWSDPQIMHNISDVATDPSIAWRPGVKPGDFWANGTRHGIDIEVLIRNNEIWTGYPTNMPINP